ncbi:biotin transporter BioY [Lichenihabitans sp. Uapishka_5]|uniref:biotin transporter BioY n=1 Tax=Lichenihabitans sp. Uapishka_5 TaxID=3037302 RepID=UPI003FA5375C
MSALPPDSAIYVPFRLGRRPAAFKALAVLAATGVLAACSWISVPMLPVPVTMQTLGVTVVAALFGWRLGTAAILAWLAEAAIGLPVLSAGHSGIAYLMGTTGGYLLAFVLTGLLVGAAAEKGWTVRSLASAFVVMAAANLFILGIGAAWLAMFVGASKAVALGVTPFLIGGILKAALAACGIEAARRHLPLR